MGFLRRKQKQSARPDECTARRYSRELVRDYEGQWLRDQQGGVEGGSVCVRNKVMLLGGLNREGGPSLAPQRPGELFIEIPFPSVCPKFAQIHNSFTLLCLPLARSGPRLSVPLPV